MGSRTSDAWEEAVPELPDVEGFRRLARRHGAGRELRSVRGQLGKMAGTSPSAMARFLAGSHLATPRRHGKWMLWPTDQRVLALHFGMDGELRWSRDGERDRYERVAFQFDDGELRYQSRRKLGGVWMASDDEQLHEITGPLGPDALRASSAAFREALAPARSGIKSRLMDQEVLAGLGNLTVDEALWRAGVDPRRRLHSLTDGERCEIEGAVKRVLRDGVAAGQVPDADGWLTSQRGSASPECPRSHGMLDTFTVGGRTTYACPKCQS